MGSASPKESHFGRSFHTSSVMCFQTEACTCNRSLASVLLASPKTPTIDSCRTHISTGFNWLRFTILLAERIVNGHLKDLTSDQRADCFVFDDSLYSRTGYKKTELAAKDGAQIDARIVCVRNRSNRKDWIALICTDMTIDENEIIRIYGKRWDIEVFFKTCKSFLKLGTEYHGLSYDALTAHTAFVFLRYMFMSVEKRDDEDDRTIGELFYCMADELADITFNYSLQTLVEAMFESVKEIFQPTEEQMERFTNAFISLPYCIVE